MYLPCYDPLSQALYFVEPGRESRTPFDGGINVFVCGALQNPEKMHDMLGRLPAFAPAAVKGYCRGSASIQGRETPFMLASPDPDAMLTGVVWLDLSPVDLEAIERLELAGGLRRRIELNALCGEARLRALSYVRALPADADPCS